MRQLEHQHQVALFNALKHFERAYPELDLLHAIPNGGKRDKITACKLKAEGVKSGVPDLSLPVARGDYHGLYIELKAGKNKPTANQFQWHDNLTKQGYLVYVCYGWQEACSKILGYLDNKYSS